MKEKPRVAKASAKGSPHKPQDFVKDIDISMKAKHFKHVISRKENSTHQHHFTA